MILLNVQIHQFIIFLGASKIEIFENWKWLEQQAMETLSSFESETDVTEFLIGKIESLIANQKQQRVCSKRF